MIQRCIFHGNETNPRRAMFQRVLGADIQVLGDRRTPAHLTNLVAHLHGFSPNLHFSLTIPFPLAMIRLYHFDIIVVNKKYITLILDF